MKYIERTGDIENIYEGTPEEIMDLYNKLNLSENISIENVIQVNCDDLIDRSITQVAEEIAKLLTEKIKYIGMCM